MKCHVVQNPASGKYDLYFVHETASGARSIMQPVAMCMVEMQEGLRIDFPSMTLDEHTIKSMMESFSAAGVKPESDSKLEGRLEATSAHLQDMRTLLNLNKDSAVVFDVSCDTGTMRPKNED